MWDQLLAKSANCRQALDLLPQWGDTIGFSGDAAGSFGMIDENEAWAVEVLGGHHWAAARVPDTMYYAQPNMPRIRQVDLGDTINFRGSADLVSFAQSLGLYDPSQGPFDVAWAYGNRDDLQNWYNTNRLWGAARVLSSSQTFDVSMPYATRLVFMTADAKLTVSGLIAVNRYHYEGTVLDQTSGYTTMTPHAMTDRPICCSYNDYSAVFQARSWLPDGVGGVMWVAPSRACSSALTPFYDSITSVPSAWTNKTAFGAFQAVADSLDKHGNVGGEMRYKHYIPLVRDAYYGLFDATLAPARRRGQHSCVSVVDEPATVDRLPHHVLDPARHDTTAAWPTGCRHRCREEHGADAVSRRPGRRSLPARVPQRGRREAAPLAGNTPSCSPRDPRAGHGTHEETSWPS